MVNMLRRNCSRLVEPMFHGTATVTSSLAAWADARSRVRFPRCPLVAWLAVITPSCPRRLVALCVHPIAAFYWTNFSRLASCLGMTAWFICLAVLRVMSCVWCDVHWMSLRLRFPAFYQFCKLIFINTVRNFSHGDANFCIPTWNCPSWKCMNPLVSYKFCTVCKILCVYFCSEWLLNLYLIYINHKEFLQLWW